MKFDLKFPEHLPGASIEKPNDVFKTEEVLSCAVCKEPTYWLEVNFEVALCSEECDRKLCDDFAGHRYDQPD
jgi:hypothetical protein